MEPSAWVVEERPSSDRFLQALLNIKELSDSAHPYRNLLRALYAAPTDLTADELKPGVFPNDQSATASKVFGKIKSLGNRMLKRLTGGRAPKVKPPLFQNSLYSWAAVAICYKQDDLFRWRLLPEVREALEALEWVDRIERGLASREKSGAKSKDVVFKPLPASPEAIDIDPPERICTTVYRILRDTALALRVKQIHDWECQICGHFIVLPDGSRYAEAHHIQPLGKPHDGNDIESNVMCLCPNHHAELDYGVRQIDLGLLRRREGHKIDEAVVKYHNEQVFGKVRNTASSG